MNAAVSPAARLMERRQIAWAAAAMIFGGAPHLFDVVPWIPVLVLGIAAWRIVAAARGWPLPSLWIRMPVTVMGFVGVAVSYRSISGVEAGSALLLVMAGMKLLETRAERDRVLVVFIAYFLLLAVFLREQAIWSLAWLVGGAWGITTALTQTMRRERMLALPTAAALAGRLLLQAVPLAVLLFVLFPRIPGPFWALPTTESAGKTGLSEDVSPGDISQLSLSDAVAFRARFDSVIPPPGSMYWRGPVLERFDGRRWSAIPFAAPTTQARPTPARGDGPQFGWQLVLEPQGKRWLLALESPLWWSAPRASLGPGNELLAAEPYWERLSYRGRSLTSGIVRTDLDATTRIQNLRLPPGRNPRAVELGQRLRSQAADDEAFLALALQLFRQQEFFYSLSPPLLGEHAVDDFLFRTRRGFCEHYASSFAVLARAGGVPARLVVGYQGGERNPLGDYWIVRQANAHAWVEVWTAGAWRRIDPTAAVAPGRIENGIEQTLATAPIVGERLWRVNPFVNRMVLSWDAANAAWDRWVLAYGPEMQQDLLLAMGFTVPRPVQLIALAGAGSVACLLITGYVLRRQARRTDRVALAYALLCRKLAAVSRPRAPTETAEHYAQALTLARPDLADEVHALTRRYLELRYGGESDGWTPQRFARAVRAFSVVRARP